MAAEAIPDGLSASLRRILWRIDRPSLLEEALRRKGRASNLNISER
jgi:hypothetical protein